MDFAKLGQCVASGTNRIYEKCPFCTAAYTFRSISNSVYECLSCGYAGFEDELDYATKHGANYARIESQDGVPKGLINIGTYIPDQTRKTYVPTGLGELDRMTNGLRTGWITIITGKAGHGKSTFASQLALNAINAGTKVCFYSGEMDADMFQDWIFCQAAGANHVTQQIGENGAMIYGASIGAKIKIGNWLDKRLYLHDSTIVKFNEKETIFRLFFEAKHMLGCNLFFIDNLMSAHLTSTSNKDTNGLQSDFIEECSAFALSQNVHLVLVAHPKKEDTGDVNDNVLGSSSITNRAANVIRIEQVNEREKIAHPNWSSVLTLSKNRGFGMKGKIPLAFDFASRRYTMLSGNDTNNYDWEK